MTTTNNAINNKLGSPFTVGSTSVTSTGTQLNYLNALTAVPINKINIQAITATGSSTYTPTSGMVYCIVEIVGAGGAGGGVSGGTAGQCSAGAGGSGGGYCRKFYTSTLIGANATVVIGTGGTAATAGNNAGGNGGDSTFTPAGAGVVLTASGGQGGGGMAKSASAQIGSPGNAGTGTNGDLNIPGGRGGQSATLAAGALAMTGQGGSSFFAPVTACRNDGVAGNSNTGAASSGYGGGSGGAYDLGSADKTSTAGANGVCIITEFLSA